jgi:GAF domain-containing protein
VVAAAGGDVSGLIGQSVPATSGTAGYVLAAGQPLALSGRSGQECPGDGVPALIGIQPTSVLCVPCLDQDVTTGALELVNKAGGAAFTFDDVEIATVLAEVTGVALSDTSTAAPAVPNPQELSGELERLALTQPGQYAAVAAAVSALIARE